MNETRAMILERHATGSPALDHILGGGIPARSVNVVAGEPGSGKTIFALQLLFHYARLGLKSIYFTTLSEPSLKLIAYLQQFSFFDAALLDEMIRIVDLGAALRRRDEGALLADIDARVAQDEPVLVVIDSFKALSDMLPDAVRARSFVYDLAVQMAGWGATTLLLGEYTDAEMGRRAEFAIADGILRFGSRRVDLTSTRELDVLKLRGAAFVAGRHFFEIGPGGMSFYPRVRGPEGAADPRIPITERVPSGVAGLDRLLAGGLPRASATVIHGGTGTGKTILGLHFLVEGARLGQPGILFLLEETPNQLREIGRGFGWDLDGLEAAGQLRIIYASPVELSTDRFLDQARREVQRGGAQRAVLDSLTSMSLGVPSEPRFRELVYALNKHFRAAQVTSIMTMEAADLLGAAQLSGQGVSFAADNVIQLRYVEGEGRLERGVSVLKARGVAHATELCRLTIGPRGAEIGAAYPSARGVLRGGERLP
jgi:circadian clock protein KaiC